MKKVLCFVLMLCLIGGAALADKAPRLSGDLFKGAKKAVRQLAAGEYEGLVTSLPFSDMAPSASEWESFAGNFSNFSHLQSDYAVAYWTGSCWKIAVPLQVPENGQVEVLVLTSEDGSSLTGYRYALWSEVESEYTSSDHVTWNKEYVDSVPVLVAD